MICIAQWFRANFFLDINFGNLSSEATFFAVGDLQSASRVSEFPALFVERKSTHVVIEASL